MLTDEIIAVGVPCRGLLNGVPVIPGATSGQISIVTAIIAAENKAADSAEVTALFALLTMDQQTAYTAARNAPILEARTEEYRKNTDGLMADYLADEIPKKNLERRQKGDKRRLSGMGRWVMAEEIERLARLEVMTQNVLEKVGEIKGALERSGAQCEARHTALNTQVNDIENKQITMWTGLKVAVALGGLGVAAALKSFFGWLIK
jgi:hypothetical protein